MRMIHPDELSSESVAELPGYAPARDQAAASVRAPARAPVRARLVTPLKSPASQAATGGLKVALPRDLASGLPRELPHDQPRDLPAAEPIGGLAKRMVDILLVILAIPLLLPLMLGIAIMLKLTDPGPLLYGHHRIGFGGRSFRCWKFRTMVVDGDAVLEAYLKANPDEAEVWRTQRKLHDDPRVTRIGAVLRKLSLDEFPQLLNVLRGEMSLVGPRPVVQVELDDHYGPAAAAYLSARPGLTGLWQISGRSDTTYAERIRLDCDYVRRWSLVRDLRIILLTIPAMALSRGAR